MVSNVIRAVGDFHLAEATIITSEGNKLYIRDSNIVGITLFEDIQYNTISGEMMIHDSAAFVNEGPIIGQEYLQLKIQTPSFNNEIDIIDFTKNVFNINSVQSRGKVGNKIQVYVLVFTSSEIVKNQRIRIKESLTGTYSEIVKQMMKKVDCQKRIYIEPTRGTKRIVGPNISPFNVISETLNNATSALNENISPSYLFYETFKGYHYRSIASLYAQPIRQTYTTYVPGSIPLNIEKELGNILNYEIVNNSNSLFNFATGVYASNLIVHNIYSKSFKTYQYNYFDHFDKEKHITSYHDGKKQYPIFSDVTLEKGGGRSSDFPTRTYLTSISESETDVQNTTIDGTEPFAAPDFNNSLQERTSTMNQLERGLILNVKIHGNTVINAGDIVKVDIPFVATYKTSKNPKNDRFYKGAFFIKKIKHVFDFVDKKHKSYLTLIKDSLSEKLDGPTTVYEPKPKKEAVIINNKEILYPQN